MDNKIRQGISRKIKDGSYYRDVRNWYNKKYLMPISERSYLIVFTIIAVISLIISISNIQVLTSESPKIPFVVKSDDSTDYFSLIKPLSDNSETPQESVVKYLITDYVKSREEYLPQNHRGQKAKKLLKKIKRLSVKTVLREYQNYMNDTNPYSPLIRYANHTIRTIKILRFSFLDNDKTAGKVKLLFQATEQPKNGKAKKDKFEAIVHFSLPDVEDIARTGAPLRFLIKYYKVKPVT